MTITCPSRQCGPVAQYMYIVPVLWTCISKVPTVVCPASKGMCPLCTAPGKLACSGWHASSAELCVTVWFPELNWNWIVSPGAALTVLGTKVSCGPPTTTGWTRLSWMRPTGGAELADCLGGMEGGGGDE